MPHRRLNRLLFLSTAAVPLWLTASHAVAAPAGGVVSAGTATIAVNGNTTLIRQGTDRAAIDWQRFNVGANEQVTFQQPSASSITLNRIGDQNPSRILGNITANGHVILSNPNGMLFGKNSRIDVAGLIATTAGTGNDAFMRGGPLKLAIPGKPDAKIVADGTITAKEAGLIAFLAPNVENNGLIAAKLGKVQLAGAETATLDLYGDGLLNLAVADAKHTSVTHTGTIQSAWVTLTAADVSRLIGSTVNVDGIIDSNDSRLNADGSLSFGGKIEVTARDVTLGSNARLRATGKDGGGIVKVGGGWQGKGTIANAKNTTVKSGARINASATEKGDGGIVAIWSDDTTQFDGTILAKGAADGNGGHIETSGKINLGLSGFADASSPLGTAGEWLLDPRNVIIQNNAVAGVENNVPGTGGVVNAPSDTYRISAESIGVALSAGNNVTITTGATGTQTGNITIGTANILSSSATDVTLTLKADASILTTGTNSITASGAGKLHTVFWSNANVHDVTDTGAVYLINTTITTNGGDFHAAGGADDGADILDLAGNIKINGVAGDGRPDNDAIGEGANINGVRLTNDTINTGTGSIVAIGKGNHATNSAQYGVLVHSGSMLQTTDGNITLVGRGGTTPTGNNTPGLNITSLATVTSANGDIYFKGTGGSGLGATHPGIQLTNGATVSSTGTGNSAGEIRLEGTGGSGSQSAIGVSVLTDTADNTRITSVDGDIFIEGHGGTGSASSAYGMFLGGNTGLGGKAIISSTGATNNAALITIKGYGGDSPTTNIGVRIENNSLITSGYGDIDIYGKAGTGSSDRQRGIFVFLNSGIESTGAGPDAATITLNGIGGSGSDKNAGIEMQMGSFIRTVDGDIGMQGTGGASTGTASYGIYISDYITNSSSSTPSPNSITASGTGAIRMTAVGGGANSLGIKAEGDLGHTISANSGAISLTTDSVSLPHTNIASNGTVSFIPYSAGTDIGVAEAPGILQINASLLDKISAGNIVIGRSDGTGFIGIGPYSWDDPVEFKTGPSGLIYLTGTQTGLPGTDASLTFSGPARTYYDINLTGTTGTGATFNGMREVKGANAATGGSLPGASPNTPAPSIPPSTPPAPPAPRPGATPIPAAGGLETSILRNQDNATRMQTSRIDNADYFLSDYYRYETTPLYTFSADLQEQWNADE